MYSPAFTIRPRLRAACPFAGSTNQINLLRLFQIIPNSADALIIHLFIKRCSNNQVNLRIWGLIKGTIPVNGFEIIKIAYED